VLFVPYVPFVASFWNQWLIETAFTWTGVNPSSTQGVYESISPNKQYPLDTLSVHPASPAEVFTGETSNLSALDRRVYARQQRNRP
jgi:hypothetical protein